MALKVTLCYDKKVILFYDKFNSMCNVTMLGKTFILLISVVFSERINLLFVLTYNL